jgi:aerotaxis receptor
MSINLGNKEVKLDAGNMIVTETDNNGIIKFASKDFCAIAGYSKEELVGQHHNLIRHPFMPELAFKSLWDTVQKGNIWEGIVVNKTKSGGYYWVKASVYPSLSSDGTVKYISVRDKPSNHEIDDAIALYQTMK